MPANRDRLNAPGALRWAEHADKLALFEEVLGGFLTDPASRANLPRALPRRRTG
jgi:hypothetical protein